MKKFDMESPNFGRFSELESYRREDGRFEFKISWPDTNIRPQHWFQSSNPCNKRHVVEGYEAVDCPHSANEWYGLESGHDSALFNGSRAPTNWFYAFGSYNQWNQGIPGPSCVVHCVEIHVRHPKSGEWEMMGRQTAGSRWWPRETLDWDGGLVEVDVHNIVTHPSFTFSVGENDKHSTDISPVSSLCLNGKALNFRSGWLHDAVYVNGVKFGGRGGELRPAVQINMEDRINQVVVGPTVLSFGRDWGRGIICGFRDLQFINPMTKEIKNASVSSRIMVKDATWEYNREALGLELFITGMNLQIPKRVHIPSGVPYYYIFTLVHNHQLEFNREEFIKFWGWLSQVRYLEVIHANLKRRATDFDQNYVLPTEEELHAFNVKYSIIEERDRMIALFSGKYARESRSSRSEVKVLEGDLNPFWESARLSVAEYGPFSVAVHSVYDYDPYNNDFCFVMIAGGYQLDVLEASYESVSLNDGPSVKQSVLGTCICVGLRDVDMLHETKFLSKEVKYYEPRRAAHFISFIALYGLRVLARDELTASRDSWDVYLIASQKGNFTAKVLALLCCIIQIVSPILLTVNSFSNIDWEAESSPYLVFLRVLLMAYAMAYEAQNVASGDAEIKLFYFVRALPEFDHNVMFAGTAINNITRTLVAFCTVLVIYEAETATDVVLNALALFFVLNVDNELVTEHMLSDIQSNQMKKMYKLKTESVICLANNDQVLPDIIHDYKTSFPSFVVYVIGKINIGILALGGVFFVYMGHRNNM